jgi:hypothetical protein
MATLIAKWDTDAEQLRCYKDNDKTKTAYPVKWNTTAEQLQIEVDGIKHQVKWNTDNKRLEAQVCIVYTTGSYFSTGDTLYEVNALGDTIDRWSSGTYGYGIAADEDYVYCSTNGLVYKLDTSFNTEWTYAPGGFFNPKGIAVDSSGNVYFGNTDGTKGIYKLNSAGTHQWNYSTFGDIARVVIDSSGNVYGVGKAYSTNSYKSLWKLNSSGVLQWSWGVLSDDHWLWDVALDSNGNVYVGGNRKNNKTIWKLNSSGSLLLSYDTGAIGGAIGISIDDDNNVYAGGARHNDKTIWKLNSSLVLQWSTAIGAETLSAYSAIDGNGNVYMCYGSPHGGLVKLNADGEIQWTEGVSASSGVAVVD